jgi:putative addiction module component (TIGR02574 family)
VSHVPSIPKAPELARLSVSDRLDLMDEIWASLAQEAETLPLPEWHAAEIQRRLEAFAAHGNRGQTADEVFAEMKRRL